MSDKIIPIDSGKEIEYSVCMYCGEPKDKNLADRIKHNKSSEGFIEDYEPCEDCRNTFNKGVPIIEVSLNPVFSLQPPIARNDEKKWVFPTGRYMVLNTDALGGGYKTGEMVLSMTEDFNKIFNEIIDSKENENGK